MMKNKKKTQPEEDERVHQKTLSWKGVFFSYLMMLLLVGIQTGIIISPVFNALHSIAKVVIIMVYWGAVALAFGLVTRWQIKKAYDRPMRKLSTAAKQVAEGDFSVYLEPFHTTDKHDYIDVMFMDFNKMVHDLGRIETLQNDFVANVSHEMKTPIAIMQNYADFMKKRDLSYEQRLECSNTIIMAAQSLNELITNILKLNKLENQEIIPNIEPYDVCEQLVVCVLRLENALDEKGIEFIAEMDDRALVQADASMLEIVWNNILSNALKFTSCGGTITLAQTSDADTVTVTITDTGCGMSEEVLGHIFDKFYQGDPSHAQQGNGLGLALVLRVIERVGGTVSVSSEPGEGTSFKVVLKAA